MFFHAYVVRGWMSVWVWVIELYLFKHKSIYIKQCEMKMSIGLMCDVFASQEAGQTVWTSKQCKDTHNHGIYQQVCPCPPCSLSLSLNNRPDVIPMETVRLSQFRSACTPETAAPPNFLGCFKYIIKRAVQHWNRWNHFTELILRWESHISVKVWIYCHPNSVLALFFWRLWSEGFIFYYHKWACTCLSISNTARFFILSPYDANEAMIKLFVVCRCIIYIILYNFIIYYYII